jgi:hypothetical protein
MTEPQDDDDWASDLDEPPDPDSLPVDLDDGDHYAEDDRPPPAPPHTPPPNVTSLFPPTPPTPRTADPRYKKSIPAALTAATVAASVLGSCGMLALRSAGRPHVAEEPSAPATEISVVAAPTTTGAPDFGPDQPIPYTATPHGCSGGATTPISVGATDLTRPWVCVLGGNLGQYLDLDLGRTMVVTTVCITAGWVGQDASGVDQWPLHRVPTIVQWSLDDNPPIGQNTGNAPGPACKHIPGRGLLASHIILLVQETSRPPAEPPASATPGPDDGLTDSILDPRVPTSEAPALPAISGDNKPSDPVDNTMAVSSVQLSGYSPT